MQVVERAKELAMKGDLVTFGIKPEYAEIGYPEDLYSHYKLDADGIIEKVREIMGKDFEEDDNWDDEV